MLKTKVTKDVFSDFSLSVSVLPKPCGGTRPATSPAANGFSPSRPKTSPCGGPKLGSFLADENGAFLSL